MQHPTSPASAGRNTGRNASTRETAGGIGFFGLLALLFIALKLLGIVTWSWWWVLFPVWGWFALGLVILAVAVARWAWSERNR